MLEVPKKRNSTQITKDHDVDLLSVNSEILSANEAPPAVVPHIVVKKK